MMFFERKILLGQGVKLLNGGVLSYRNLFLLFNPSTLGFFPPGKSVLSLSLLSRLAPKCQFSLSFTPTYISTIRCFFMSMPKYVFFNSAFENLPFPLYLLLLYPITIPSNFPLLLNVFSLIRFF